MNPYTNGSSVTQREYEWELQESSHYAQFQEQEAENEYFFKQMLGGMQKAAKAAVPLARKLAPIAAKTLAGSTRSPIATNLLNALLRDGELSTVAMEAQFFGSNQAEAEVSYTEAAYEAALAEVLAAEASHSGSESEAEAFLGAAVPGIVKSMGGGRSLRAILPTLVVANARLVRLLHQKGTEGRRLLRLVPGILRRTVASLRAAHQAGRPVSSDLALRLMASHASRVFSSSAAITGGITRNALIQKQTTRQP